VKIWGWEEIEELEKMMLDYIRWIFNLNFCTPTYIIMRELRLDKLRVGWDIKVRRYEEKVEMDMANRIAKEYWQENQQYRWRNKYRKGREEYYNRNGWGTNAWEVKERKGGNEKGINK